jgi:hypothetical protein
MIPTAMSIVPLVVLKNGLTRMRGVNMTETMMEELMMTLRRIRRRFLREMPLRSRCPSQSRCLRRSNRRRSHTRWSSPKLVRRCYPRPPQRQHCSGFPTSTCSFSRMSLRIPR